MSTPDLFADSPFDAIREVRGDGSEFWPARELQTLLGYEKWARFADSIDRARASAAAVGHDVHHHFPGAGKMVDIGSGASREVADVHLSRFAAYLVAMNGDPRKPEVAAAQAYFAVKTREAETSPPAPAAELSDDEVMLKALTIASARVEALTARAEKAEGELTVAAPKADAFDSFLSTSGDYSVNEAAKILSRDHGILTGEKRLRGWMEDQGWIYRDGSGKPRAYQTRIDQGVLAEKAQWHYHPSTGEKVADAPQVRVTAKGLSRLRSKLTNPGLAS